MIDVAIVTLGSVILGVVISLILNFFGLGAQQLQAGSSSQILQLIRDPHRRPIAAWPCCSSCRCTSSFFGAWPAPRRAICSWACVLCMAMNRANRLAAWSPALHRLFPFRADRCFWVSFGSWATVERQGWHDKLAKTHVVYTWDVPPGP